MATATTVDLWPDDIGQETGELGPIVLLKAQAALLSAKTKGLVTAEVRSEQDPGTEESVDTFYLVGPTINYRYLLFGIRYPIQFYPANLFRRNIQHPSQSSLVYSQEQNKPIENDEELREELRQIFDSEQTRKVVSAIIQRSK